MGMFVRTLGIFLTRLDGTCMGSYFSRISSEDGISSKLIRFYSFDLKTISTKIF